jgi:hypothetical protein
LILLGRSPIFTKRTPPGAESGGLELLMLKVSNHSSASLPSLSAIGSALARRRTGATGDGLEETIKIIVDATAAEVITENIAERARMAWVFSICKERFEFAQISLPSSTSK